MSAVIAMTGASGFVGRHTVAQLVAQGHRMRILARDAARAPSGAETVVGDLSSRDALKALCADATAMVHMAGAIAAPGRAEFFAVNESGTRAVAEAAAAAGVKRFVHISSLAAREPSLSDYAASKRAGEEAVAGFAGSFGLAILRPPAVYGPGDRATLPLLRQLTRRLAFVPGRLDARFSLIHAHDVARLVDHLLGSDWTGLAEIDDGRPGGYGWADLARLAGEAEGHGVHPVCLPRFLLAAVARLAPAGGLTPGKVRELYHVDWVARGTQPPLSGRTGFAEGFRATVAWYRAQGWLPPAAGADRRRSSDRGETAA